MLYSLINQLQILRPGPIVSSVLIIINCTYVGVKLISISVWTLDVVDGVAFQLEECFDDG